MNNQAYELYLTKLNLNPKLQLKMTKNSGDTIRFLSKIFYRIELQMSKVFNSSSQIRFKSNYKEYRRDEHLKKKIRVKQFFKSIVENIPTIGTTKALKLSTRFGNMADFIELVYQSERSQPLYAILDQSEKYNFGALGAKQFREELLGLVGKDSAIQIFRYFGFDF